MSLIVWFWLLLGFGVYAAWHTGAAMDQGRRQLSTAMLVLTAMYVYALLDVANKLRWW